MSPVSKLKEFLDAARSQGATDEILVGLLRGRGWSEEDVYRALADHYEGRTGIQVPVYKRSGSAKDAFLYLLSFSTLAIWASGLGWVMFTLIDSWIKEDNYSYSGGYYELADSLACIIVTFPIYLMVMRYIIRELEVHPEKLESAVRKWLTYIALLITACVVVGDLIMFLTYLLRGELAARFVARVGIVLVIAGGIFWYYAGSLRRVALPPKNGHE